MAALRLLAITLAALALPALAGAQDAPAAWTPEVSIAAGLGHVFRWEDQTFGDRPAAGGGLAVAHRSGWVVQLDAHNTFGLRPKPQRCGLVGITCLGQAREGPDALAALSLTVHHRFGRRRLQPYVLAGLGMMWSRSVHSLTQVRGATATVTEWTSRDSGVGPEIGGGFTVRVSRRLTLSPEIRWLEAVWRSRENLSVARPQLRASYSW